MTLYASSFPPTTGGVVTAINLAVHRSLVSMEDLVVRFGPTLT